MYRARQVIGVGIGIFLFFFIGIQLDHLYASLTGYDIPFPDNYMGYRPPLQGILTMLLSGALAYLVGNMIYSNNYKIFNQYDEERFDVFLAVSGLTLVLGFDLLKEMALIPYSRKDSSDLLSFMLDILVVWGVWWSLLQYRQQKLSKDK